jgi:hypothetical protein
MAELKKYTSFEALKLVEKFATHDGSKDNIFAEFEAFLKRLQRETPIKRISKSMTGSSLTDSISSVCID